MLANLSQGFMNNCGKPSFTYPVTLLIGLFLMR